MGYLKQLSAASGPAHHYPMRRVLQELLGAVGLLLLSTSTRDECTRDGPHSVASVESGPARASIFREGAHRDSWWEKNSEGRCYRQRGFRGETSTCSNTVPLSLLLHLRLPAFRRTAGRAEPKPSLCVPGSLLHPIAAFSTTQSMIWN